MKKNLFIPAILFVISSSVFSQTAVSIQNGNWLNPMTWNCTCIPLPGYSVTINHAVSLDTSWYVPSGGITINSGGSLIKNNPTRDLLVNGGNLTNNGTLDVRYLFTQAGTFSNSGTLTARSFLNYINFTNTGIIQNIDSLYSTASIINNGNFLNIDSITTGGTFVNNGICTYNQFTNIGVYTNNKKLTFTDITNLDTLNNADTIIALNSGWNAETWKNLAGSYFLVGKSFFNGDSVQKNATFTINGRMVVNDSWYNADTTTGTSSGSIQVADSSVNWGWMKGSFDFCDLTPPSAAPFVDFNFGTISSGVTWCQYNGIHESEEAEILFYPNPASDKLFIHTGGTKHYEVKIFSTAGGNPVKKIFFPANTHEASIDISALANGLYIVLFSADEKQEMRKIAVMR